jgi:hypothetical protein
MTDDFILCEQSAYVSVYARLKAKSPVLSSSLYELQFEIEKIEQDISLSSSRDEKEHRKGIVSILYEELRRVVSKHQQSELAKLEREIQIDKYFQPNMLKLSSLVIKDSPAQKNLDSEGQELLSLYQSESSDSQVLDIRRKVQETSALLAVLSSKAAEQAETASAILQVADESVGFVERAESHLKKAVKHNSSYRTYLVFWFMSLSALLWIFHFLK